MNALEKYVTKVKLASALKEKLAAEGALAAPKMPLQQANAHARANARFKGKGVYPKMVSAGKGRVAGQTTPLPPAQRTSPAVGPAKTHSAIASSFQKKKPWAGAVASQQ